MLLIYCPHAAHGCVKLQSEQTYGICTTDNDYIYENSIVQLASVGLAQARPNYNTCMHLAHC